MNNILIKKEEQDLKSFFQKMEIENILYKNRNSESTTQALNSILLKIEKER